MEKLDFPGLFDFFLCVFLISCVNSEILNLLNSLFNNSNNNSSTKPQRQQWLCRLFKCKHDVWWLISVVVSPDWSQIPFVFDVRQDPGWFYFGFLRGFFRVWKLVDARLTALTRLFLPQYVFTDRTSSSFFLPFFPAATQTISSIQSRVP